MDLLTQLNSLPMFLIVGVVVAFGGQTAIKLTKHLTKLGAKDYKYPHAYKGNFVKQDYMKIKIKFYEYGENKFEIAANERLKKLWGE